MHPPLTPRDPIQCIVPPHMVEAIKLRGDRKLKRMAARIEKEAEKFRQARQGFTPPTPVMAVAPVPPGVKVKPERAVYDAENRSRLPGKLVREEGDRKSKDTDVNRAYDGAGHTFKLYLDVYRRNSLDGNGMRLVSTVHYARNYNNAFWDGQQMVYGDGDGIIFKPLTRSLTVIGHELSHGVVQFSGDLVYRDQPGALHESFADVFGCLTLQYKKKQTAAEADWLVGDEILGPNINGVALRSLKAPGTAYDDPLLGKDPQPYHMDGYVNTHSDNGGVHINSSIPNHAFYLMAQYLGGTAWERAGQIWYDTMQSINNLHATFADWADETVERARDRYGAGSMEAILTRRSWKLVGIGL